MRDASPLTIPPDGGGQICIQVTNLNFTIPGFSEKGNHHGKGTKRPVDPGNGVLHFTNLSGVNWTTLILTETGVPAHTINCSSDLFQCTVVPYGTDGAQITLIETGAEKGIGKGQSFEIACNGPCPLQISAVAKAPPVAASEPSGLYVMLAGLGAMLAWGVLRGPAERC